MRVSSIGTGDGTRLLIAIVDESEWGRDEALSHGRSDGVCRRSFAPTRRSCSGGVCTGVHSIALARNEVSSFGVDRDRTMGCWWPLPRGPIGYDGRRAMVVTSTMVVRSKDHVHRSKDG